MIVCAELLAYHLRRDWLPNAASTFHIPDVYLYLIVPTIFICFLQTVNTKFRTFPLWKMAESVFRAVGFALLTITMLMYLGNVAGVVSRLYVAMTGFFAFFFVLGARALLRHYLNSRRLLAAPVLFVGAEAAVEAFRKALGAHGGYGMTPVGAWYTDRVNAQELAPAIAASTAETVIVTATGLPADDQARLIGRIQPLVESVVFVPDLPGAPVANIEVQGIFEGRHMFLRFQNNLAHRHNRIIKRAFDLVLCLLGLVVVVPVCAIIAIAVRLDSKGPAIFVHHRIGQGGRTFPCYKFRTMIPDAEAVLKDYLARHPEARKEWEKDYKLKDDPRVTRLGAFLRKTSLDELPQVFNVLKGDMSLVGPRPIVRGEIPKYGEYFRDFCIVPPGITGMWQASGRSDTTYEERVQMDTWYVRNWSVWIDITYLCKTFWIVLARKGAY